MGGAHPNPPAAAGQNRTAGGREPGVAGPRATVPSGGRGASGDRAGSRGRWRRGSEQVSGDHSRALREQRGSALEGRGLLPLSSDRTELAAGGLMSREIGDQRL